MEGGPSHDAFHDLHAILRGGVFRQSSASTQCELFLHVVRFPLLERSNEVDTTFKATNMNKTSYAVTQSTRAIWTGRILSGIVVAFLTVDAGTTRIAGKVMFQASDTTAAVPANATILEVADEVGVFIDNACRSGTCASCRVKLVAGNVSMAVEDALTEQDKAEGFILACQAKIYGDVRVDA